MLIKNRDELLTHGNIQGRKVVLDILEAGLAAPDPYENTKKMVRVENGKLYVGHPDFSTPPGEKPLEFDLAKVNNIYVVGGGKAVQQEAKALEDVLGDLITEGHVCTKKGDSVKCKRIGVTLAGHPIPDEDSVAGASKILEIEKKSKEGDIVFWVESGGGSALIALPAPGVTLEDLKEVNRILYFGCGASMPETNAVRNLPSILRLKHPKWVKGATLIHVFTPETPPNWDVHIFRTSDVHVSQIKSKANAYDRAMEVMEKYKCWDKMPVSIQKFLEARDPQYMPPTEEELTQRPLYHYRVVGPEYMLNAAEAKARELGLNTQVVVSSLSDVEAAPVADTFAYIAKEIEALNRPFSAPCCLIMGGELVVTVGDGKGIGGRNQEFVLGTAPRIAGSKRIVIGSADSDGTDGPTDVAGGIVDGETAQRVADLKQSLSKELRAHNSYGVMSKLGDTIFTGNTGTNVRDLRVVYVGKK